MPYGHGSLVICIRPCQVKKPCRRQTREFAILRAFLWPGLGFQWNAGSSNIPVPPKLFQGCHDGLTRAGDTIFKSASPFGFHFISDGAVAWRLRFDQRPIPCPHAHSTGTDVGHVSSGNQLHRCIIGSRSSGLRCKRPKLENRPGRA